MVLICIGDHIDTDLHPTPGSAANNLHDHIDTVLLAAPAPGPAANNLHDHIDTVLLALERLENYFT